MLNFTLIVMGILIGTAGMTISFFVGRYLAICELEQKSKKQVAETIQMTNEVKIKDAVIQGIKEEKEQTEAFEEIKAEEKK